MCQSSHALECLLFQGLQLTELCALPFPRFVSGKGLSDMYGELWAMIVASVSAYIGLLFLTTYIWKGSTLRMLKAKK